MKNKENTQSKQGAQTSIGTVKKYFNKAYLQGKSNRFFIAGVVIALIVGGVYFVVEFDKQRTMAKFRDEIIPDAVRKMAQDETTPIAVSDMQDKSGVYKFTLDFGSGDQVRQYESYITKDGGILFASGTELESLDQIDAESVAQQQPQVTCDDIEKQEQAEVTAYVVSQCPFGLQAQRLIKKTVEESPEMAQYLNVKYIGEVVDGEITAMHGDEEAQENLRQICIREEQGGLYWPYVSCYMKEAGSSEDCLAETGVNAFEVGACMEDASRGLAYAQADFDSANKHSVTGSPTLIVNDAQRVSEFDFGGRVPNALKDIVCCGSTNQPSFCESDLSTDQVAVAFSPTDDANAAGGAAASCN